MPTTTLLWDHPPPFPTSRSHVNIPGRPLPIPLPPVSLVPPDTILFTHLIAPTTRQIRRLARATTNPRFSRPPITTHQRTTRLSKILGLGCDDRFGSLLTFDPLIEELEALKRAELNRFPVYEALIRNVLTAMDRDVLVRAPVDGTGGGDGNVSGNADWKNPIKGGEYACLVANPGVPNRYWVVEDYYARFVVRVLNEVWRRGFWLRSLGVVRCVWVLWGVALLGQWEGWVKELKNMGKRERMGVRLKGLNIKVRKKMGKMLWGTEGEWEDVMYA